MSENTAPQGAPENTAGAGGQPETTVGMIPKARFDEVNEARKAAQAKLDELSKQAEERKRADLEAKGEYDKLKAEMQAELEAARKKAEAWDTYQVERREELLKGLTDEDKALVDGLPLAKVEAFVSRLGQKPAAKGAAGNPGGSTGAAKFTREQLQRAVTDTKFRGELGLDWAGLQREISQLQ